MLLTQLKNGWYVAILKLKMFTCCNFGLKNGLNVAILDSKNGLYVASLDSEMVYMLQFWIQKRFIWCNFGLFVLYIAILDSKMVYVAILDSTTGYMLQFWIQKWFISCNFGFKNGSYVAILELKMFICCNFGRKLCCGWKEMSLPDLSRASINKTQASHHSKWCHLFSSAQKWCQSCQSYVHANTCKHTCKHKRQPLQMMLFVFFGPKMVMVPVIDSNIDTKNANIWFLATLVALHLTPVSE